MPVVSISDPLDSSAFTSLYLYGQLTVPPVYADRLRDQNSPTYVVNVGASFWNANEPGRFAMPALAPFVSTFFSGLPNLPTGVQQLYADRFAAQGNVGAVRITVADLMLAGVPASQFNFSFAQYGFAPNSSDYGARTYIYNNESFSISPTTVFVFDPLNDNSHLENLSLKAAQDNFDYVTAGWLANIADATVLQNKIDPYEMGQQLLLSIPDSPVRNYTLKNFQDDSAVVQTYTPTLTQLALYALPAALGLVDSLTSSGLIQYSKDGVPIVYGTNGNDTSSYFDTAASGGASSLIAIAGQGDDQINGRAGDDSLVGGKGNDILRGNAGNDFLDGGVGTDTALFDDGPGGEVVLKSGGSAPADPGLAPTDIAPYFTVTRGQEVDVLHSIEKIKLSSGADNLKIDAGTNLAGIQEIDAGDQPSGTMDVLDLSAMGKPIRTLPQQTGRLRRLRPISSGTMVIAEIKAGVRPVIEFFMSLLLRYKRERLRAG